MEGNASREALAEVGKPVSQTVRSAVSEVTDKLDQHGFGGVSDTKTVVDKVGVLKSSSEAIGTPKRFAWSAFPEWVDRRAGRDPSR
jgi:hypothetical protein